MTNETVKARPDSNWKLNLVRLILFALVCGSFLNLANADDGDADVIVEGLLSAKTETTVTVDSVVFRINDDTEFEDDLGNTISFGAFSVGDFIKVEARFIDGELFATEVELEDDEDDEETEVEVEGFVQAIASDVITVQGLAFLITDSTAVLDSNNNPIQLSSISVGDKVEVEAQSSAPTTATKIKLKLEDDAGDDDGGDDLSGEPSEVEVYGSISAVSATSITVSSVQYQVTATTRVEDDMDRPIAFSSLSVGDFVKVEFFTMGESKIARKIELEDEQEREIEVTGAIAGLSATSITVRGITAALSGDTEYQGPNNTSAERSDLRVGILVKLNAREDQQSTLQARRVRIREQHVGGDFDDDGTPERVVYRSSLGQWFINYGTDSDDDGEVESESVQWGLPGDIPINADIDGDRRNEIVVFRPANGTWYIRLSSSGYNLVRTIQWGIAGDTPIAGDYDGDGKTDIGIWRASTGEWFIFLSSGGDRDSALALDPQHMIYRQWGLPSHQPVVADRDGDNKDDLIVWDTQTGVWYTLYSSGGYNRDGAIAGNLGAGDAIQFGLHGDEPLAGDLDGDGKDDCSVFRDGLWFIRFSGGTPAFAVQWGLSGDVPGILRSADSLEDLRDGLVVYRPAEGNHYGRPASGEVSITQWGLPGTDDVPVQ